MAERHLLGDCKIALDQVAESSVDLIVTSPPYADARKKHYEGVPIDAYVEWFLERSREFQRALDPEGTFILNIKERVLAGERCTYVLELIQGLRRQGWLWTEEWIWHKKNSHPGKWPNRFRDGWERVLQFNLQRKFAMYQDAVRVPIGSWSHSRLTHLRAKDRTRDPSGTGSGFGKNVSNWVGRELVYPDNVLHFATETGNKSHAAAFPEALPTFFIKLFTQPGDTVLDPFAGSGTTGVAAVRLGRHYIGIDTERRFQQLAEERIRKAVGNEAPGEKAIGSRGAAAG
jgi:site-specific DNA-methyltransferase (adenine-specific)